MYIQACTDLGPMIFESLRFQLKIIYIVENPIFILKTVLIQLVFCMKQCYCDMKIKFYTNK